MILWFRHAISERALRRYRFTVDCKETKAEFGDQTILTLLQSTHQHITWTASTIIKQVHRQYIRFNGFKAHTNISHGLHISHLDINTEAYTQFVGAHFTKNRELAY
jgi:hypothetical protein